LIPHDVAKRTSTHKLIAMELSSTPPSAQSTSSSSSATTTVAADRKVLADLEILSERLRRCDELLAAAKNNTNGSTIASSSTALLDVVGFLEASAPRMVELVEVAAQGAVSDAVLMKCLDVNDRLTKALSDIDAVTFVDTLEAQAAEPDIAVTAAPPAITTTKSEDEFDAFLSDRVSGNTESGPDLS
jgi:hypothetical protein